MRIESRLKRILIQHGLDRHGVIGDIAEAVGVHRQTIAKLYSGQARKVDLDVLGKIVAWLRDQNVPGEKLPGSLFGGAELWERIRSCQHVHIYLGEYENEGQQRLARSMIARRDAQVAASIVQELTRLGHAHVDMRYIPLQFIGTPGPMLRPEDKDRARHHFQSMRLSEVNETAVFLVGSQKINLMTEQLVADLWGAVPFRPATSQQNIPFFMRYRHTDPDVPSCFGGNPPPGNDWPESGVYYRVGPGRWQCAPFIDRQRDAGIVIVTHDDANEIYEIAILGFSSAATAALGHYFLSNPDQFWPPTAPINDRVVGVYICSIRYDDGDVDNLTSIQVELHRIEAELLRRPRQSATPDSLVGRRTSSAVHKRQRT